MYQRLLVNDTIIQFIVIIKTTSSSIKIIKRFQTNVVQDVQGWVWPRLL